MADLTPSGLGALARRGLTRAICYMTARCLRRASSGALSSCPLSDACGSCAGAGFSGALSCPTDVRAHRGGPQSSQRRRRLFKPRIARRCPATPSLGLIARSMNAFNPFWAEQRPDRRKQG